MLDTVTRIGGHGHGRGERLSAMFGCMDHAAMRPEPS
jgi:hypothetical protein